MSGSASRSATPWLTTRRRSQRLDPAPPFALLGVPASSPQPLSERVAGQHHGIRAGRTERLEPVFRRVEQCAAHALTPPVGPYREPVQVIPPAIPARDDRARQFPVRG